MIATLVAALVVSASCRQVSFWYSPAAYGGGDINNTIEVLQANAGTVDTLYVYCGYSVNGGLAVVPKEVSFCVDTGLLTRLISLGVHPELVLDSGSSDVVDFRAFFANGTANIAAMVSIGKALGVSGWSFDLEPQVGSPASTVEDAHLYAQFLSEARKSFNAAGMRLTVAVAEWSPMTSQYEVLAPSVDRLLDMETYNADSFEGWMTGDSFGGYYTKFLAAGAAVAAPGLGCWNATCGDHTCWTSTPASGEPRLAQMAKDGIEEVALFRLVQQEGVDKMPQDWWWPLLKAYKEGSIQIV